MTSPPASSPSAPNANEGTEGRALIGFMEPAEALAFLRQQCYAGSATDADLKALHEGARKVAADEAPCVPPEVRDLEERHKSHLALVAARPEVAEAAEGRPWSFKMVEIDRLIAFQKFIDVDRGAEMASKVDFGSPESVLGWCLPAERVPHQVAQSFDARENAFTLMAQGQDFRLLGNASLELPDKKRVVGFVPGFGNPLVQVVRYQGRCYLKNGYHRLYQLRANGVTHAPCVLIEATAFQTTGAGRDGFFPEALVTSARPPTMADFAKPAIAPLVRFRPWTKIIRIRAEEIKVPAELAVAPPPPPATGPAPAPAAAGAVAPGFEDFVVAREGWNAYRLEDGTVVKVRQLLLRIPSNIQPGVPGAQFSIETSQPIIAVFAPPALRGPPTQPDLPPADLEKHVVHEGMKWEVLQEARNEYVCANGARVELALRLGRVARTNRFAGNGDPVYLVNTDMALNVAAAPPTMGQ